MLLRWCAIAHVVEFVAERVAHVILTTPRLVTLSTPRVDFPGEVRHDHQAADGEDAEQAAAQRR